MPDPQPCSRCHRRGQHLHALVDELGAGHICGLCVIALLAAAETRGLAVSIVLGRPAVQVAS